MIKKSIYEKELFTQKIWQFLSLKYYSWCSNYWNIRFWSSQKYCYRHISKFFIVENI